MLFGNFLCDHNLVSSGHVLLRFCIKNDKKIPGHVTGIQIYIITKIFSIGDKILNIQL